MRHMMLTLFMMIAVGVFAIAEGRAPNPQTPTGPQVINLLRTDGAGANVRTVELAAGAMDARDSHPGAGVIYVLEGAGSLEVDGKPPVALKADISWYGSARALATAFGSRSLAAISCATPSSSNTPWRAKVFRF